MSLKERIIAKQKECKENQAKIEKELFDSLPEGDYSILTNSDETMKILITPKGAYITLIYSDETIFLSDANHFLVARILHDMPEILMKLEKKYA